MRDLETAASPATGDYVTVVWSSPPRIVCDTFPRYPSSITRVTGTRFGGELENELQLEPLAVTDVSDAATVVRRLSWAFPADLPISDGLVLEYALQVAADITLRGWWRVDPNGPRMVDVPRDTVLNWAGERTKAAAGLPTFLKVRADAYAMLGDVQDVMRSDWVGDGPTATAAAAWLTAKKAISQAKDALNHVAHELDR